MDNKEFKKALDLLVKEKDISVDYVIEAMTLLIRRIIILYLMLE